MVTVLITPVRGACLVLFIYWIFFLSVMGPGKQSKKNSTSFIVMNVSFIAASLTAVFLLAHSIILSGIIYAQGEGQQSPTAVTKKTLAL